MSYNDSLQNSDAFRIVYALESIVRSMERMELTLAKIARQMEDEKDD